MKFIKRTMDSFRSFKFVDVMFFELYLFTAGIVIAMLIPAVLTLSLWLYVGLVAVGLLIIIPSVFKKGKWLHNFIHLSMWKVSVYKLLVVVAAFLLLKLVPEIMTVSIVWFVAVACFGLGWMMAVMFR
jgi:hypothetical protein